MLKFATSAETACFTAAASPQAEKKIIPGAELLGTMKAEEGQRGEKGWLKHRGSICVAWTMVLEDHIWHGCTRPLLAKQLNYHELTVIRIYCNHNVISLQNPPQAICHKLSLSTSQRGCNL